MGFWINECIVQYDTQGWYVISNIVDTNNCLLIYSVINSQYMKHSIVDLYIVSIMHTYFISSIRPLYTLSVQCYII